MRTTCPEMIRTINRRKEFSHIRRTKPYRDRVRELNEGKGCIICGSTERLGRHHTKESDYQHGPEHYIAALDWAVPMCFRCHIFRWHKGKTKICPECGKELIAPEYDRCWNCISEEEKEQFRIKKQFWKDLRRKFSREAYERIKEARTAQ
jgi:hypothetical protein